MNFLLKKNQPNNRYIFPTFKARGWQKWKRLFLEIIENPILIALTVFLSATSIVITVSIIMASYNKQFFNSILAGAHGTLLNLFVIGIIILWLNKIGEKRTEIRRYQEELDDFRGWQSEEAARRIRGIIKRLNNLGVTRINLSFAFLPKMNLKNFNFQGSDLSHADLQEAYLQGAILSDTSLQYAKLVGAHLNNVDLTNADLKGANLQRAAFGSLFSGIDNVFLKQIDMANASFESADLRGVSYLNVEQLLTVKTLYNAKLDTLLFQQIINTSPHLLEKPQNNSIREPKLTIKGRSEGH